MLPLIERLPEILDRVEAVEQSLENLEVRAIAAAFAVCPKCSNQRVAGRPKIDPLFPSKRPTIVEVRCVACGDVDVVPMDFLTGRNFGEPE